MHFAETTGRPYARGFRPDALADRLPPTDLAAMSAAVEMVTRLHRQKDSLGIAGLIEAILAATGYEAALLSEPHGRRKVGNVRMLIDRGRSAWREGLRLADFITQMNALTLSESRYEQAAVAGEGDNVVRLMTIHKAKGLEFPVVFVSDLNAGKGSRSYRRVLRRADWGLTCRAAANEDDGEADKPLSYRLAGLRERADNDAETIRQYYVALTRHKDLLVLVGADWRNKDGQLKERGSFLRQADDVLMFSRVLDDGDDGELPYGDGRVAACRRMTPTPVAARRGRTPPGRAMLAKAADAVELVDAIRNSTHADAPAPPLLGPLPLEVGRAELAVTALGDFAACPMLYRWRYELRVPAAALPADLERPAVTADGPRDAGSAERPGVDAATAGTFFHRCMELMDFAHPQPAANLARQAAEEMSLPRGDAAGLADELAEMVRLFRNHELWPRIAQASRTLRELEFLLTVGPATLRGKIDLVVADPTGEWHVVDYKSDRLADTSPAGVAHHSDHHRLQMLTYAMAAGRHLQGPAPQATLYYLRPAVSHTYAFDEAAVADGERELAELARSLIAARRSGQFEIRRSDMCGLCPYAPLCERFAPN